MDPCTNVRLKDAFVPIKVWVYPLHVQNELRHWPEQDERQRNWLTPKEARLLVDEPELVSLIDRLDNTTHA